MVSLKIVFASAADSGPRVGLYVLVLMMLFIDDDRQRRDRQKRKKRNAAPATPRPC